jgi:Tetrahydrofolate dehydrogenase/cyclohydrolase, catalytic domain/Methylenetetrahydrofolate reductase
MDHGLRRIGVARYPEGHPKISDTALADALSAKQPYPAYMVSQLCFSPDVLVAWLRRVRAAGITLPLHLGLAAPTPMRSARDAERSRTGQVIDGRTIARGLKAEVAREVKELHDDGITAGIATLLIGGDYPARAYEQRIGKMAAELGVAWYQRRLPEDAAQHEVLAEIARLNADPAVSGMLILRAVPAHIQEEDIFTALEPAKDIEAVHPENAGPAGPRPASVRAIDPRRRVPCPGPMALRRRRRPGGVLPPFPHHGDRPIQQHRQAGCVLGV